MYNKCLVKIEKAFNLCSIVFEKEDDHIYVTVTTAQLTLEQHGFELCRPTYTEFLIVNPVVLDDRWFLQSMDVQLWKGGLTVKKVKVNFCVADLLPQPLHCLRVSFVF